MRQSMEAESFIGDTVGGPVVVYLEVCDHEVPLVTSPVMQATRRRIVDMWVWLHLMLTFACSGEPLPTHCSTKFTAVFVALMVLASCGMFPQIFSRPRHLAE